MVKKLTARQGAARNTQITNSRTQVEINQRRFRERLLNIALRRALMRIANDTRSPSPCPPRPSRGCTADSDRAAG